MTGGLDLERIVIASDGSASAGEALAVGLDLAQDAGADVTIVRVLAQNGSLPPEELPAALSDEAVEAAASLAQAQSVEPDLVLRTGDVVDEIARAADDVDADLIIVGSRGLSNAAGAVLGSVSRALLARSERPILIVRGSRERHG